MALASDAAHAHRHQRQPAHRARIALKLVLRGNDALDAGQPAQQRRQHRRASSVTAWPRPASRPHSGRNGRCRRGPVRPAAPGGNRRAARRSSADNRAAHRPAAAARRAARTAASALRQSPISSSSWASAKARRDRPAQRERLLEKLRASAKRPDPSPPDLCARKPARAWDCA